LRIPKLYGILVTDKDGVTLVRGENRRQRANRHGSELVQVADSEEVSCSCQQSSFVDFDMVQ